MECRNLYFGLAYCWWDSYIFNKNCRFAMVVYSLPQQITLK
ncbi:hypothetical protein SPHINGOT1_270106 [Sphingomonas sp. T1]|nr:hypothetical protein SPHINGOT1_270106 [Sphingomonas sp. T1]